MGTLSLPQLPLRCVGPVSLTFTFVPLSLSPTLSGPTRMEGASVGQASGLGSQQAPQSPSGQVKCWPHFLLILCPPNGPPPFPSLGMGTLLLSHRPSGVPVPSASTSHPPSLLPTSYLVTGGSSHPLRCLWSPPVPGRCPSCTETQTPHPPTSPS